MGDVIGVQIKAFCTPYTRLEPKGFKIIGVEHGNVLLTTRIHQWTVKYQPESIHRVLTSGTETNRFIGPPLKPLNWCKEDFEKMQLLAS